MSEAEPFYAFDGAFAWSKLTHEQRDGIGAVALEIALVCHLFELDRSGAFSALPPRFFPARFPRLAQAAEDLLLQRLSSLATDALPSGAFCASFSRQPRVPSVLGRICRRCGCSEFDLCEGGCGWAGPELCTACEGDGVA